MGEIAEILGRIRFSVSLGYLFAAYGPAMEWEEKENDAENLVVDWIGHDIA